MLFIEGSGGDGGRGCCGLLLLLLRLLVVELAGGVSLVLLLLPSLVHGESVALGLLFAVLVNLRILIIQNLAAVKNVDGDARPVGHVGGDLGDLTDSVHTFDDLAENHMLPIEVLALLESYEELGGVGVRATVGH